MLIRATDTLCRCIQYFEDIMNEENVRIGDEKCVKTEDPINEIIMDEVTTA